MRTIDLMENVQQMWTTWLLYKHRAQFTYKHNNKSSQWTQKQVWKKGGWKRKCI